MASDQKYQELTDRIYKVMMFFGSVLQELYFGIRSKTIPAVECMLWGMLMALIYNLNYDYWAFKKLKIGFLYPVRENPRIIYVLTLMFSGFLFWGVYKSCKKMNLLRRLTMTFNGINLKNALGQLPHFIKDEPLDQHTRLLKLAKRSLPMERFEAARSSLESALQIYIDELRDNRKEGTIDIIYAKEPMPENVVLENFKLNPSSFIVGKTRSGLLAADLRTTPHLLVAGQTGGGKSTFIRQWIATLYLSNPKYKFCLIDLKGGLEFQTFSGLPRIKVFGEIVKATSRLKNLGEELEKRMTVIKEAGAKDIDSYLTKNKKADKESQNTATESFDRQIIVIDEAAELFLSGGDVPAREAQSAREVISKIARQGRAVGMHLVIGTQRPDSKALDTQIKANLTGKICFQVADQHSSMVVLGNARARDLPPIAGRAIWQNGMQQVEVQIPYLGIEATENALKASTQGVEDK